MPAKRDPFILKERLGENTYDALVDMIDDRHNERMAAMEQRLCALNDRFDRLDEKLTAMTALFDEKQASLKERFERRMADDFGKVRLEINGLRTEMVTQRADLLKWALVSWVSQAAAVATIVAVFR